nr:ABC transporter ATP-binding protein [Raoultella sp. NCTC 9187]
MSYLHIASLRISYGDKVVLHNIDLAVEKGEMIALLGPSGCGKNHAANALSALSRRRAGRSLSPQGYYP